METCARQYNMAVADDREHAGNLLSQKLLHKDLTNAVIVAVQPGGVPLASAMAERLNIPFEMMPCRIIRDPSCPTRNIGAVTATDVFYHDYSRSIPQDYVYFQTLKMRNEVKYDQEFYYGQHKEYDFTGKTVIVTDDLLTQPEVLLVALASIRKQRASEIIVAVPFVESEPARIIQSRCNELIYIRMKERIYSPGEFYKEYRPVDDWAARAILFNPNVQQEMSLV